MGPEPQTGFLLRLLKGCRRMQRWTCCCWKVRNISWLAYMLMFCCVSKAVNSFCQVLLPLVHVALAWPAVTVSNCLQCSCTLFLLHWKHAWACTCTSRHIFSKRNVVMPSLVCFVVNSHHYIISDKLSQTPGICTYNSCTALKKQRGAPNCTKYKWLHYIM